MIILSHRGYWKDKLEKNLDVAFDRSFSLNFGTETDVRDYQELLVISHDIPNKSAISIDSFFQLYTKYSASLPLALNIKADGLHKLLLKAIQRYDVSNYFVFDMSIPDTKLYLDMGFNVFSRVSEYEPTPAFYDKIEGIWLDAFHSNWFDKQVIQKFLDDGKKVCIVSSELHGRDYEELWYILSDNNIKNRDTLMLCTDIPEKAKLFFS
jgi:hypothetical protein